ncbi:hypothetical protein BH09VER1_BH09VER1_26520 [soil metagenome]
MDQAVTTKLTVVKNIAKLFSIAVLFATSASGQIPTGTPQNQPAVTPASSTQPKGVANPAAGVTGVKELPVYDPGSDQVMWDGQTWSVTNNRLLEARFEKYLNEPEDESAAFDTYSKLLSEITDLVTPNPYKRQPADWMTQAFAKLQTASQFPADAGISETVQLQVVAAWQATNNRGAMVQADKAMEDERKRIEWNRGITLQGNPLEQSPGNNKAAQDNAKSYRDASVEGYNRRLKEIEMSLQTNQVKNEVLLLKSKLEFQALVVQLFFQRRFQLCIIASRLYGAVYQDGDRELQVGDDAKKLFSKTSGMPPSLQTLESMSREIMADVEKGVASSTYLIGQNEIYSGSKRLLESFLPGEYMPAIRTLPRETKRKVLAFERNHLKLISALEVKDYDLAAQLLPQLAAVAQDYDNTRDRGVIETAKAAAGMHLAKAQAAALNGDKQEVNTELELASQIWPRNPGLKEAAGKMLAMSGEQGKAIIELDNLQKEKNDRAIFEQKERFIAAAAYMPDRQKPLGDAIARVTEVEKALEKAREMEKTGNAPGAWEVLQAATKYSNDNKLSAALAQESMQCAEFVTVMTKAQAAADSGNLGSALALYLKAKDLGPGAEMPVQRLNSLSEQAMPEAKVSSVK